MLFNSYDFIFLFLPISLGGFFLFSQTSIKYLTTAWLIFVSLGFYAYWNLSFLFLLLFSVIVNWQIGELIAWQRNKCIESKQKSVKIRLLLFFGIGFNLCLLGYFKYTNFFIDTINNLGASLGQLGNLTLPLGISFYTFEQISYIRGVASGHSRNYGLPQFLLFVSFFPHLIAGPILNAKELIPQFRALNYCFNTRNIAIGLTVFAVGLFKKTVIADSVAVYATPIFAAAEHGRDISFFVAWQAAIAYTLQLYFDFSGYSDMAIGLAKMFNIKLPMNFFSPYKAIGIGDFWRRWHISLSRFLRDYLYIPLGGSRKGQFRRSLNLLITMLLGGLWHGASWTFILWGGLHGTYLCIDSGWQQFVRRQGWQAPSGWVSQVAARALTFLAVVISWVLFRSETLNGARQMFCGLLGLNGFILPQSFASTNFGLFMQHLGVRFGTVENYGDMKATILVIGLLAGVFLLPNIYEFMHGEPVVLDIYQQLEKKNPPRFYWQPTAPYAVGSAILLSIGIGFCSRPSEFLYFQF